MKPARQIGIKIAHAVAKNSKKTQKLSKNVIKIGFLLIFFNFFIKKCYIKFLELFIRTLKSDCIKYIFTAKQHHFV